MFESCPSPTTLCLSMVHLQEQCQGHRSHRKWSDGDQGRPRQQYSMAAISAHIPEWKQRRGLLSMEKKCNRTLEMSNGKWKLTSLRQVPISGCAEVLSCSLLFLIQRCMKIDSWVTCLIRISKVPVHSSSIIEPTAGTKPHEGMDIQVHAGPNRACGRLPQWSSCEQK